MVGGEAGVLFGRDIDGLELATGVDAHVFLADFELDATLLQLSEECAQVFRVAAIDVEVAAGDGSGDEEGSGLNAVGVDAVASAVKLGNALDTDH